MTTDSFGARLWRAYSFRRNLRNLVQAPDSHDRPLDGLRALSILWVLSIHTIWFLPVMLSVDDFRVEFDRFENNVFIRWLHRGELGVDLFFVLSGYLIGSLLMKEHSANGSISIGLFYVRRFMRLMPVYFLVLGLAYLAGFPNSHNIWANLLYVNNFIPIKDEFLNWTWSLAIEEQFYIVFPFFLVGLYRLGGRLKVLAGLLGLSVVIRMVLIFHHHFTLPIVMHPIFDETRANHFYDTIYLMPHARYGSLLAGVIVAYLLQYTKVRETLRERSGLNSALLFGGMAAIILVASVPIYSARAWPAGLDMAYLAISFPLFGVGAGAVLLAVICAAGAARPVAKILSARFWLPIAQLSYSAYLVHPIVMVGMYLGEKQKGTVGPIGSNIVSMYLRNVVFVLIVSLILYLLIEKPIMNLRPLSKKSAEGKASDDAAKSMEST
ncbi:MAG TPA: acyltransferase [Polyangium sp.]|nr:acyltransferase [Polyangium sp.]